MKQPTIKNCEQWACSRPVVNVVYTYITARAYAETVRGQIDDIYISILRADNEDRWLYRVRPEWKERGIEFITKPDHSYLMTDEDFKDYHAECQHRLKKAGWKFKPGNCPALVAEELQRQAGRALLEITAPRFNLEVDDIICSSLDIHHKFIDLTCRLVVGTPEFRKLSKQ